MLTAKDPGYARQKIPLSHISMNSIIRIAGSRLCSVPSRTIRLQTGKRCTAAFSECKKGDLCTLRPLLCFVPIRAFVVLLEGLAHQRSVGRQALVQCVYKPGNESIFAQRATNTRFRVQWRRKETHCQEIEVIA